MDLKRGRGADLKRGRGAGPRLSGLICRLAAANGTLSEESFSYANNSYHGMGTISAGRSLEEQNTIIRLIPLICVFSVLIQRYVCRLAVWCS